MNKNEADKHTDDLAYLDAVALAKMIREGQISPVESIQAAIDRIEHLNPKTNAVIHQQFEQALANAASPNLPNGPFRGVPMLMKDLWAEEAGQPHHAGMKCLRDAQSISDVESHMVTRYKQAGFVILGRTNTPELGLVATTEPQAYGPTRNPWSTDHSPGGSSGGAAAAVASGMLPAANASDGGGSIRIPAAMCGLVGLKPSRGRVPMGPVREEWGVSVQHVLCHTVRDSAAILDATAIPFPGDGVVAPEHGRPYIAQINSSPEPLRIGIMDNSHRVEVHPDCVATVAQAADLLSDLGHEVVNSYPEALGEVGQVETLTKAFAVNWTVGAALNLEYLAGILDRELVAEDVESGTWTMAEMGRQFSALEYARAQSVMARWRRSLAMWWADGNDLLLTPTTALPPPPIGELTPTTDEPLRGSQRSMPYATFTSPFNTTGQPAISLPLGFSKGLPVGVQLVAAYGREDLLVGVSSQLEDKVDWSKNRAPTHA